uniref:DUF1889 family protein n=1 Tax=Escherichia coli TaxID=562 RepID=UPI0035CD08C0
MQIKVIYSLIDNMVNFKDKNMPAVIDKALDFIGAMDVSAPTPSSMNESTAKGIFKYLKELGGNDSNLLIVFYVQIMPDDFVMQLHRF